MRCECGVDSEVMGRVLMMLAPLLSVSAFADQIDTDIRPMPRPDGLGVFVAPDSPTALPEENLVDVSSIPRAPLFAGQDVFAVAEFRCGVQADFLRGYWADVAEPTDPPVLRIREHLVVMANHGLTDEQGKPDTTSSFWGEYWCIPQRAWCYERVADTAFKGTVSTGSVLPWPTADIAPLDREFVPVFAEILNARCTVQAGVAAMVLDHSAPLYGPQ
jgi:hypothetical protein